MNELYKLGLVEVREKLRQKEVSAVEVTEAILRRIDETKALNTLLTVTKDEALAAAAKADECLSRGEAGALTGVPIIVKDNICTEGIRTTCASKFLENYVPPYDATVVKRLKEAGAVIVGKANMDEFAMGSSNENSAFGPARNAVDPARVPGGSSGGSASAVAAFNGYGALGSDTGGSIRQPAAFCGVVGLKPTYSAVSRYGLIAFASSLDQIGPLARSVRDCAILFDVIAGPDPMDSTATQVKRDYLGYTAGLKGLTVGVPKEFFGPELNGEIGAAVERSLRLMERAGAKIKQVSVKSFDAALACYYVISSAEASSNLARFDGVKYGLRVEGDDYIDTYYRSRTAGFGPEVKRRIMTGNYVLSSGYYDAYYLKATKVRTKIREEFDEILGECDLMVSPTSPTTAFKLGEEKTPTEMYLGDVYTVPVNIAGNPAMSMPCGVDKAGLPIGLQFIGRRNGETAIFAAGEALEKELKA